MEDELRVKLQPKQWALRDAILDQRIDAPTVLGYGGSRGAAKSGGVRRIALSLVTEKPDIIVWIVRRVWDDLNKDHVQPLFKEYPSLQQFWRAIDKELRITHPGGKTSSIFFIHAGDSGRAKRKARGPQAHYIFLEQAEEFSQQEMEQLAGSNRAPGVGPGYCKRIYTFNPGGIGTNYLRRIMWLRDFHDNEDPKEFWFQQAYGWDNYEWFRALGIVSQSDFYRSPEWNDGLPFVDERSGTVITGSSKKRFETFITKTDFGRKLNALPPSQRIGELLGSFEKFSGQYFADVWEEKACIIPADLVSRIVKPWWKRWLATDWGFSHYTATGWFTAGAISPEECLDLFNVQASRPVNLVIMLRELVCNDVEEPALAQVISSLTPEAERREVRFHFIGHDAWAKRGSANTVVEQMDPVLQKSGLQRLCRADIDRVGGWRLIYNCWAETRRFRSCQGTYEQGDLPVFLVSAACPETINSIPVLIADEDNPTDILKIPGEVSDDVADMVRYGLKSYLSSDNQIPRDVTAMETYERYQDPTARAMAMLKLQAEQSKGLRLQRKRRF